MTTLDDNQTTLPTIICKMRSTCRRSWPDDTPEDAPAAGVITKRGCQRRHARRHAPSRRTAIAHPNERRNQFSQSILTLKDNPAWARLTGRRSVATYWTKKKQRAIQRK